MKITLISMDVSVQRNYLHFLKNEVDISLYSEFRIQKMIVFVQVIVYI